jgi:hypothetical protein
MENIIALLMDAKRDIERGRVSGSNQTVFLDCALIYIEGAIEIAKLRITHEAAMERICR